MPSPPVVVAAAAAGVGGRRRRHRTTTLAATAAAAADPTIAAAVAPDPAAISAAAGTSSLSRYLDGLTPEQVARFEADGYLALPGFATPDQIKALMARVQQLIDVFDPHAHAKRLSVFSTDEAQAHAKDAYFLDSASEVNFFFEAKAFDDQTGELRMPKALALNKIGHALHDVDPVFRAFLRQNPSFSAVLRSLGFKRPLPVQSMYIFKQPFVGGEVTPHQDSAFLYTDPPSCVGLWLALEDATRHNGCLWALPAVHKQGLARRFRRLPDTNGVGFDGPPAEYDAAQFKPLECTAGTLVLLHGANVHYSAENTSPLSRHSYAMHVVDSAPGFSWAADNWAHRRAGLEWQPLFGDEENTAAAAGSEQEEGQQA